MKLNKSAEVTGRAGDLIAEGFAGPACPGVDIVYSSEMHWEVSDDRS